MFARRWRLAWAIAAIMSCFSDTAQAQRLDRIENPMQLEAPEKELSDPVQYGDLLSLSRRLWYAGCRTRICTIWYTTAGLYYDSHMGRAPQGTDCISGLRKCPDKFRATSQRLNREINTYPAWRAQICDAIAAVAARDDGTAAQTHPDFGANTLDLARRLTTPKLACLTKVWRVFRPSPYRDEALGEAIWLCQYEGTPARECASLQDVAIGGSLRN